jgi:hypothetical protein
VRDELSAVDGRVSSQHCTHSFKPSEFEVQHTVPEFILYLRPYRDGEAAWRGPQFEPSAHQPQRSGLPTPHERTHAGRAWSFGLLAPPGLGLLAQCAGIRTTQRR